MAGALRAVGPPDGPPPAGTACLPAPATHPSRPPACQPTAAAWGALQIRGCDHPSAGMLAEGSGSLEEFTGPTPPQFGRGMATPAVVDSPVPSSPPCWAERAPFSKGTWGLAPWVRGPRHTAPPSVGRERVERARRLPSIQRLELLQAPKARKRNRDT